MLRTESRVVEDTLQVSDLDSVGIRDKDTVREAFEKEFKLWRWQVFWSTYLRRSNTGCYLMVFKNCVARLASQLKSLRKDPEILIEYDSILQDQLQSGIIQQVDCSKRPDVGRVY